jgi:transposase
MTGGVQLTNQKRRQYSAEFKREAVELVTNKGYTIAQAARNLGITDKILGRWRREQLQNKEDAFPGTGHQSQEVEELNRLREENRKLKLEREILKKAAAFFAKESG